ncbi:hypothetical protein AA313_de0206903 [Arthrobotrys entomopaga]|nr:hypothetical protein AA313_de0206903 [Arthrobotrys entomopaga]
MTMGLEKCDPNDLFLLDSSYLARIALRKDLVVRYPDTLGASLLATEAIKELYKFIFHHLSSRFPELFIINAIELTFNNNVSGDTHPLQPENPLAALKAMASTVEEDVLVLMKNPEEEVYRLRAFAGCFPNGFAWSQKMGMAMSEIHDPVPLFKEKLGFSVNRFFGKLEVGRWVKRFNWTVSIHDQLCSLTANHIYQGEEFPEKLESVNLDECYLRVERQVLLRLPLSRAIVFFVKTYMTPLSVVKTEGQGEALAAAIEGMPETLAIYKGRNIWGDAVVSGLRS